MRSIKSELYLFVKTMVLGGNYTDGLEEIKTFEALAPIKHLGFWNSELTEPEQKDTYPVFALFFEFSNSQNYLQYQKTGETDNVATTKDLAEFTLHLVSPKLRSEQRDEDYLEMLDTADLIFNRIQDKTAAGIQNIKRIRESQDINNEVLMDWQMVFTVNLTNCGNSDLVNAQDPEVNPSAPVEQDIQMELTKTT